MCVLLAGPIIGSAGLKAVGFPVLMGLIGTANLCYCAIIPNIGRIAPTQK
jgi:hypothetical protein